MWNLRKLAEELKELTPKLKKDGKWNYADSVAIIQLRLQSFLRKFPNTDNLYTEEQVINAYKAYIKDTTNFDGSISRYRKLLKYFIWKLEDDGDISSTLLTYLENPKSESVNTTTEDEIDWIDEVI